MLFALLVTFAPGFCAAHSGEEFQRNESRETVSAAADPGSDGASLLDAGFGLAGDTEDGSDEEAAIFFTVAMVDRASVSECPASDAWFFSFRRPSAHFCTGPPIL